MEGLAQAVGDKNKDVCGKGKKMDRRGNKGKNQTQGIKRGKGATEERKRRSRKDDALTHALSRRRAATCAD